MMKIAREIMDVVASIDNLGLFVDKKWFNTDLKTLLQQLQCCR